MLKKDNWIDDNIRIVEFCGVRSLLFNAKPGIQTPESHGIDYVITVNNKYGLEPKTIKNVEFSIIIHNNTIQALIGDCIGTIFGPHGQGPESTVLLNNVQLMDSMSIDRAELIDYIRMAENTTAEMLLDV